MNNEYLNDLNAIITRAQKDALNDVETKLLERWEQINHILTYGRPIWEKADGEKFDKMFYLRNELYLKMKTIRECCVMISVMRFSK